MLEQRLAARGTKQEVWDGVAARTPGGLTKDDLMINARGAVVSAKQSAAAKKRFDDSKRGVAAAPEPLREGALPDKTIVVPKGESATINLYITQRVDGEPLRNASRVYHSVSREPDSGHAQHDVVIHAPPALVPPPPPRHSAAQADFEPSVAWQGRTRAPAAAPPPREEPSLQERVRLQLIEALAARAAKRSAGSGLRERRFAASRKATRS